MLLLDGYDEINEPERDKFIKNLKEFLVDHPKCTIIVASRISTVDDKPFGKLGFISYTISPLSENDIKTYISKFANHEIQEKLWPTIQSNERLMELAQVPFMLAMICVTDYVGSFIDRATLFKECTQYLLRTRHENGQEIVDQELEDSLKAIAVHFYKLDAKQVFEKEDMVFAVSKVKKNSDPKKIIRAIAKRTGLIQPADGGYRFIHRSIWEYYAALGMKGEFENLLARASMAVWEEPIKLYVAMANTEELETVIKGFWIGNRVLTLRAITELSNFPEAIVRDLVLKLDRVERVRLAHEIISTAEKANDEKQKKRILLDSTSALLKVEKDCEVIYHCIIALIKTGDAECEKFVHSFLDIDKSYERRNELLCNNEHKFEFVSLEGGEFIMGLDNSPDIREQPAHPVELSHFEIGKYLITNSVYYNSFPYTGDKKDAYSNNKNQPANNITWFEAVIFAWWLGCDLPTEAEWEYACRAGGKDDHLLFNTAVVPEYAWYEKNSDNRTHSVGLKKANSYGIYDMLGNVREWVKDWYSESAFYEKCFEHGTVKNPVFNKNGDRKVLRGGVFDWSDKNLRPTYRPMNPPENVFFGNGFRLVFRKEQTTPDFQQNNWPE